MGRGFPAMFKIAGKEHYLTLGELAKLVQRDRSRIKQLERQGRIPAPIRVRHGRHHVRLYSPEQVAVVVEHFKVNATLRPQNGPRRRRHWKKAAVES